MTRAWGKGAAPGLAVLLFLAGCAVHGAGSTAAPSGTTAPSVTAAPATATTPATTAPATTAPLATVPPTTVAPTTVAPTTAAPAPVVHRPVTVTAPTVGIAAPLVPLGLGPGGELEVPTDFDFAGWYAAGPEPGEPGPTVIVGHVDSYTGPAVFFRLGELAPGDEVTVTGDDGTSLRYVVRAVERHPKDEFPTDAVYGPTPTSTLRLVTCGGEFDRVSRHYLDNVVVFADLAR